MKMIDIVKKTLYTRVTPLAYLLAFYQIVFGLNHLIEFSYGAGASLLSRVDPLIPSSYWGLILLVSAVVLTVGCKLKHVQFVQISSMAMFLLWVMAAIGFMMNGYIIHHGVNAIVFAVINGYYFLASSLGTLWDFSPDR